MDLSHCAPASRFTADDDARDTRKLMNYIPKLLPEATKTMARRHQMSLSRQTNFPPRQANLTLSLGTVSIRDGIGP